MKKSELVDDILMSIDGRGSLEEVIGYILDHLNTKHMLLLPRQITYVKHSLKADGEQLYTRTLTREWDKE